MKTLFKKIGLTTLATSSLFTLAACKVDEEGNTDLVDPVIEVIGDINIKDTDLFSISDFDFSSVLNISDNVSSVENIKITVTDDRFDPTNITTGTYKFKAVDEAGNFVFFALKINVVDTTAPTLTRSKKTLNYAVESHTLESFKSDIIYDLFDYSDNLTATRRIVIGFTGLDAVDFNTIGQYPVTVNATDLSGNTSSLNFIINIVEKPAPGLAKDEIYNLLNQASVRIQVPRYVDAEAIDAITGGVMSVLFPNATDDDIKEFWSVQPGYTSTGSGWFVGVDYDTNLAYIATNVHVIDGAEDENGIVIIQPGYQKQDNADVADTKYLPIELCGRVVHSDYNEVTGDNVDIAIVEVFGFFRRTAMANDSVKFASREKGIIEACTNINDANGNPAITLDNQIVANSDWSFLPESRVAHYANAGVDTSYVPETFSGVITSKNKVNFVWADYEGYLFKVLEIADDAHYNVMDPSLRQYTTIGYPEGQYVANDWLEFGYVQEDEKFSTTENSWRYDTMTYIGSSKGGASGSAIVDQYGTVVSVLSFGIGTDSDITGSVLYTSVRSEISKFCVANPNVNIKICNSLRA